MESNDITARQVYWRENRRWMLILGAIWFVVSLGCGVLWVEPLNQIQVGGFKLGSGLPAGRHLHLYRTDLVYARVMARLKSASGSRSLKHEPH